MALYRATVCTRWVFANGRYDPEVLGNLPNGVGISDIVGQSNSSVPPTPNIYLCEVEGLTSAQVTALKGLSSACVLMDEFANNYNEKPTADQMLILENKIQARFPDVDADEVMQGGHMILRAGLTRRQAVTEFIDRWKQLPKSTGENTLPMAYQVHAKVSGSQTADENSTALQTAIDEAIGREVVLPPEAFAVNAVPTITAGKIAGLIGTPGKTIILPTTYGLKIDTGSTEPSIIVGLSLYGITIRGGTHGIYATGSRPLQYFNLDRVNLQGQSNTGLYTECELLDVRATELICENYGATLPLYGAHLAGNQVHFNNKFYDCSFRMSQLAGLYLDNPNNIGASAEIFLQNTKFESNRRHGLRANNTRSLAMHGGYIENNSQDGQGYADFKFDANCQNVALYDVGGSFDLGRAQPQIALECQSGLKPLLVNCRLSNNAGDNGYHINTNGGAVTLLHTPGITVDGGVSATVLA